MKNGRRVTCGDPALADFILFDGVRPSCRAWTLPRMGSEANLASAGGRGDFSSDFLPFLAFLNES